jgi:hypothetical protein
MLLSGADRGVPEGDCVLELLLLAVPWSSVFRSPLLMTCTHRKGTTVQWARRGLQGLRAGQPSAAPWPAAMRRVRNEGMKFDA